MSDDLWMLDLLLLIGAILGALAFRANRRLERDVAALRQEVARLQAVIGGEPPPQPMPEAIPAAAGSWPPQSRRHPRWDIPDEEAQEHAPATPVLPPVAAREQAEDSASLEQAFASRWLVWLGGLTLALGGVFLARYAIEQGLLGPAARMTLAVLLGLALVLGGEWLRRRPLARDLGRIRGDQVPSALVAAGLSIASAAIYASFALHDLLGPATTFVALAALCLAAQGLALRHGALVALLGLAGGLAFPALIPSDTPSAWTLLAWLLLLTIATLVAARRLGTPWLALPVLAGHAVWTVGLLHLFPRGAADWAALLYVLAVPPLVTWATLGNRAKRRLAAGMAEASGWLATVLAVVLAGVSDWSAAGWAATILVGLLLLALAATEPRRWRLSLAAGLLTLVSVGLYQAVPTGPTPGTRLLVAGGFGIAYLALGTLALLRHRRPARAWALLSGLVPLGLAATAYARWEGEVAGWAWLPPLLLLTAALASLALFTLRRGWHPAADAHAATALAAAALTLVTQLDQAPLTVALSLLAPLAALASRRTGLTWPAWGSNAVAAIVLSRLLLNQDVLDYPVWTPFPWVLWGYGIPALAFWWAARQLSPDSPARAALQVGSLVLAVVLPALAVKAWTDGSLRGNSWDLLELSLRSLAWLATAAGLAGRRHLPTVLLWGGRALLVLAGLHVLVLQLLVQNPLWTGEDVGPWPVLNLVLLAYLAPVPLLLLGARLWPAGGRARTWAAAAALLLAFAGLSLEVRQAFQGRYLYVGNGIGDGELYAYSVLWLLFALGLLAAGIRLRLSAARYAALAVLMLTVAKVFLLDMADLEGLLRILSFFGLGASLIGIGWLYQRFVQPPRPAAAS